MMSLLIVTVTAMLLAAIMSAIAWRIAGDERRRSEARVAALAAEIHHDEGAGRTTVGALFDAPPPRSSARAFAIVGGGALVFGAAVALAILSSGRFSGLTGPAARTSLPVRASIVEPRPLELVALGHERVGDQLTVRGVVRNPATGTGVEHLTAVVLLFTPDGGYLETGRADVDAAALRPGGESTFVVTVPRAADVARYRVSFRADDRLIPHLDRRHES